MTDTVSREIHLVARPDGWPIAADFQLVTVPVPEPGPDQLLIRNVAMSVDPYMRGRMNDAPSYVPPYRLGEVMDGRAVGEVLAGAAGDVSPGDYVLHGLGWREYAVVDAGSVRRIDVGLAPPSAYLGVLGMPGLTAYVGLLDIAAMRPGETVFVSGAAGAVGSLAGQIAKLRGAARVVGSAGSAAKVEYVRDELGFDAAFNYHDGPVHQQLARAAPDGIDVYFDNVGGEHLEAALFSLTRYGRVALCGAISQYNSKTPVGPRNLGLAVGKRLLLRGFIVTDHAARLPEFSDEVGGWLREGKVHLTETVVDGIEHAPEAFIGMLRGENLGKMVVRLA